MFIDINNEGIIVRISEDKIKDTDIFIDSISLDSISRNGKQGIFDKKSGTIVYMTKEELALRQTDYQILRHLEEKELIGKGRSVATTLTEQQFEDIILQRKALRDTLNQV